MNGIYKARNTFRYVGKFRDFIDLLERLAPIDKPVRIPGMPANWPAITKW